MTGAPGLRVGLVCPYSFETHGGVQNHILGLANYLRSVGHEPHVIAPGKSPGGDHREEPRDYRFTSSGASMPLRYNGSVARVGFGPISSARVRSWLRDNSFDLLHIHEPITPSISILSLWAADQPVVATFHTATARSRSMQLAGGVLRAAVEKIHAGIAVSESARKVVVQHLGRDALVIPNGFSFHAFGQEHLASAGPEKRWRGGDRPRIVFLGRVDEPRKGLDVLLAAVPQIRARIGDIDVVVAGYGRRTLPPGCRFVGEVTDRAKSALLASADVFVAPHRSGESFGIVVLEAMASGAPVVASDLPAFRDLLAGGASSRDEGRLASTRLLGQTFPAGDSRALAATVERALTHPDHHRTEVARCTSRSYDWSVVGAAVVEVYEATLAANRAPAGFPCLPGTLSLHPGSIAGTASVSPVERAVTRPTPADPRSPMRHPR